jgi:hypothetical protein
MSSAVPKAVSSTLTTDPDKSIPSGGASGHSGTPPFSIKSMKFGNSMLGKLGTRARSGVMLFVGIGAAFMSVVVALIPAEKNDSSVHIDPARKTPGSTLTEETVTREGDTVGQAAAPSTAPAVVASMRPSRTGAHPAIARSMRSQQQPGDSTGSGFSTGGEANLRTRPQAAGHRRSFENAGGSSVAGFSPKLAAETRGTAASPQRSQSEKVSLTALPDKTVPARIPLAYQISDEAFQERFPDVALEVMDTIRDEFDKQTGSGELPATDPEYARRWSRAEPTALEKMRTLFGWAAVAEFEKQAALQAAAAQK